MSKNPKTSRKDRARAQPGESTTIEGLLDLVGTGDTVVVDGHEGVVFVGPDHETERACLKEQWPDRRLGRVEVSVIEFFQ